MTPSASTVRVLSLSRAPLPLHELLVGGPPPIGRSALVKSSGTAVSLLQVKTQLVLERFDGKAVLVEDSGGKTEPLVAVMLGSSARQWPTLAQLWVMMNGLFFKTK